jgi:hypothetical protein
MADEQPTQEMDPKFQALRRAIAGDVADQMARLGQQLRKGLSDDVSQQVTLAGQQLRKELAGDVSQQVTLVGQQLRKELSGDVSQQVTLVGQQLRKELSGDIAKQLETAGEHLAGRMQVHAEELRDLMQKAAEGYGGTLDGIQRELKEFREEWRKKAADTDLILADHNSRITSLEHSAKS